MVAGGLVRYDDDGFRSVLPEGEEDPLHAVRVMSFAKAMMREARSIVMPTPGEPLKLRCGIHSGSVMSGSELAAHWWPMTVQVQHASSER